MHFGSEEVPHWNAISLLCNCDLFIGPSGVKIPGEFLDECLKHWVLKERSDLPRQFEDALFGSALIRYFNSCG